MNIQWYPGHMAKTRRMIGEKLRQVDAVCELLDARIPSASRNPDIDALTAGKPRLVILNRADQADKAATDRWADWFRGSGAAVLVTDAKSGRGTEKFAPAVRALLSDKLRAYAEKGQAGRIVRVMALGIPNVGKSAFINRVAGRRAAKAEDRPGVTRTGQWVPVSGGLELLDTPGILWPKFEDPDAARYLAFTGAVKDDVMDVETLGCYLAAWFADKAPHALKASYKLPSLPEREAGTEEKAVIEQEADTERRRGAERRRCTEQAADTGLRPGDVLYGWRVLDALARRRGFLVSGGETDTERMANTLLDEFRSGKLGRFTLEAPREGSSRFRSADEERMP